MRRLRGLHGQIYGDFYCGKDTGLQNLDGRTIPDREQAFRKSIRTPLRPVGSWIASLGDKSSHR